MGLDIYSGTLTTYYSGNWETQVQKYARENNLGFIKTDENGNELLSSEVDYAELTEAIVQWQNTITETLASNQIRVTNWLEKECSEYFTDKPDWDAFGALLLYTASMISKTAYPAQVEKGFSFMDHPAVKQMIESQLPGWSFFARSELWLPYDNSFSFYYQNPFEKPMMISTLACLKQELERINAFEWKADEKEILNWSASEGYPTEAKIENGKLIMMEHPQDYSTESLAKFAFSIFYRAALFAAEHQVPIILDY